MTNSIPQPPIVGFVAASGTGKTTLITRLIPLLEKRGIIVAIIKHSHHNFEIDKPGKDSYLFRSAGAQQTIIASKNRIASITEFPNALSDITLAMCEQYIDNNNIDLVIVEGFKHEIFAKIEVHRSTFNHGFLFPDDNNIIALVTDTQPGPECALPIFDINEPKQVSEFLIRTFNLKTNDES